jgi:hypothetical protein
VVVVFLGIVKAIVVWLGKVKVGGVEVVVDWVGVMVEIVKEG